jgi:hypothetical protein
MSVPQRVRPPMLRPAGLVMLDDPTCGAEDVRTVFDVKFGKSVPAVRKKSWSVYVAVVTRGEGLSSDVLP